MIEKRTFTSLGRFQNKWLNARHHFSFSNYRDPKRDQWGTIRVWNDDEIEAGQGFAPHGHSDMEIITYVREGAITHQDSLGNKGRTGAGDVQVMSAGSGVTHSEFNLEEEATTLFQIWIETDRKGFSRTKLDKQGWWASDTAALYFDDVRVPVSNLIGGENQGFMGIMLNFNGERLGMAASATGSARGPGRAPGESAVSAGC